MLTGEQSDDIEETNRIFNEEKIYNRTNNYRVANEMAKKIREYDSNYFIVITSNYAWESYFSEELGKTIEDYGGFLIKEFMHQASARFGHFTHLTNFQE